MVIRILVLIISILIFTGNVVADNSPDSTFTDTASVKTGGLSVLPFAFYSPQTKFAFGILPTYIFYTSPESRPSSVSTPAYYTTQKQFSGAIKPEYYSGDDRNYLYSEIVFLKWPEYYYGIGSSTSKDDEEEYTINRYGIKLTAQREFFDGLYLGLTYDFGYVKFSETEANGLLENGTVIGSEDGGISGIGLASSYDTRDLIYFPGKGNFYQFNINFYGGDLGSDYTYNRYTLDLRQYFTLADNQYVAVQTLGDFIDGNPPFTVLPRVGDIIRGYYPTRYTDNNLMAFQSEYRLVPLWKRLGIVLFGGVGGVAPEISEFDSDNFKFGAGFGIRYVFVKQERLNLSVDIGFGESGAEFYMAIAEAF